MNKIEGNKLLKACPLCGGRVRIYTAPNRNYGIECQKIGCITMAATYKRSIEKLVRDWNNRANEKNACEPEYLGENTAIGCRDGKCKCGNIVRSYQNYCDDCGAELLWENVRG